MPYEPLQSQKKQFFYYTLYPQQRDSPLKVHKHELLFLQKPNPYDLKGL